MNGGFGSEPVERADGVVVNDVLSFSLCGHDGVWAGCASAAEYRAYEIRGGRLFGGDGRVDVLLRCRRDLKCEE